MSFAAAPARRSLRLLSVALASAALAAVALRVGPVDTFLRSVAAAVSSAPIAPPPPDDRAGAPLGHPPPVPVTSEPYAFMGTVPGTALPVAYDPCRPIHYVIRRAGAPPDAERLVARAVAVVGKATGLVFAYDGTTDEAPTMDRPVVQRERYGNRWAPVLVAWSDPRETPSLAGRVLGRGGSASYATRARLSERYVTGQVVFNAPGLAELSRAPGGGEVVQAVVLHELGHLVGLAHVADELQLMNDSTTPFARTFAGGDRQGLAELGRGRCFDDA